MNPPYPRHIYFESMPFRPQWPDDAKHETELFRDASDMGELYLSAPFIPEIRERFGNDPVAAAEVKALPEFQWEASAEEALVVS